VIVDVGPVGHGGICIAHAPDGRAVMVRHALPGEQVRVEVTEERRSYLRADAVEIITASQHRVEPPCRWAGPGRCGGCDWQHVDLAEQRRLKQQVIAEQMRRIAGLDVTVSVQPCDGDVDGLQWRTRLRLAVDETGVAGLYRHRSHIVEPVDDCLLAAPDLRVAEVLAERWPGRDHVDLTTAVTVDAVGRRWSVPPGGFWQVHPGAPDVLAAAVVELTRAAVDHHVLDLYAGVGLFAGVLAARVPGLRVTAVESSRTAADAARSNLADLAGVEVIHERVDRWLVRARPTADAVVLDPPRKGAGRAVVERLAAARPRVVVYVACDPAALARDVALFGEQGYRMTDLRGYDLFPMTAHVECVARLEAGTDTR
jgi:tRNA/tmRNA/rRNA uracil-C5-methylase (TrmA/RlmC/RlmD family)